VSHYFRNDADQPERRRTIRATVWGEELEFTTANGVFSADGLDPGTSMLLRESPVPTGSVRLLDLGCGWGPIAVALARRCPGAAVDAVDVNDRALALCHHNAKAHGVAERVTVRRPEDVPPETRYDQIWSNPPIRVGKDALHALLLGWLPRLVPDGTARLVVGRNLGADSLQRWLADQGYPCRRAASAKGFRVLVVTPPPR
jgi:16S rRNA (guanine1207-N2)-methyltransferase